ncbi:MAG: hypothetical protein M1831_002895 [Alyxoria varia]|nr:MAG: hypothetical protein M1831_002895 [Alyxoria varia]
MPARIEQIYENGDAIRQVCSNLLYTGAPELTPKHQIVVSSSDNDFLDSLIVGMRSCNHADLHYGLERLSRDRDGDIEHICTSNHQQFVNSINKLDHGREDCTNLGTEILNLVQSYQDSIDNLAAQKKNLVDSRSLRQNMDESSDALKESLEVLRTANQVHDLVGKQNHYAALRALDELQAILKARESTRYNIGDLIEKSIPATQKMIAEAVMSDLNTWLYRIRDVSQYIGEVAFFHTETRRTRHKERSVQDPYLGRFKLNSPIELVADETEEIDVLDDEDADLHVDFTPLFECMHIHEALGQSDRFRSEYGITRRRQKDLIIPVTLRIEDEEVSELKTLLESIAGFSIVERATMRRTENLRTTMDVDELWDSMSQSSINLISGAVHSLDNPDLLLKVTGVISLFIQTMEVRTFPNEDIDVLMADIWLAELEISFEWHELLFDDTIVATDDYMPMPIGTLGEYKKIIELGWYIPDKEEEDITYVSIVNHEYLAQSSLIDNTIKSLKDSKSLDELLCDRICRPLIERLSSQYPGQIVQILTNLEHFENACHALQEELAEARTSRSRSGPVALNATQDFASAKGEAKQRIFELVNSKIDDLVGTAEYDWTSTAKAEEPSNYMVELTRYLGNIMNSVLLGLPMEIKDMIYFDSLSHAATNILSLPLEDSVRAITPASLQLLSIDVQHLSSFISTLSLQGSNSATKNSSNTERDPSILNRTVDELTQTVNLMTSDDPDQFYDIGQRSRHYGAVNPQNGAELLEKVERGKDTNKLQAEAASATEHPETKSSGRFGNVIRGFRRGTEGERGAG